MDERMRQEMERCQREGTPRPESSAVRAHVPATMGQQSWLRLLDIEHHEVLAGTAASMAPGFETSQDLTASKASPGYWASARPA
jgi:hypothetical protein